MDINALLDSALTSNVPLPAPTTVTSRSLRPRSVGGHSTRSNSISTSASRTQSRSNSVMPSQDVFEASVPTGDTIHTSVESVMSEPTTSHALPSRQADLDADISRADAIPRKKRRLNSEETSDAFAVPTAGPSSSSQQLEDLLVSALDEEQQFAWSGGAVQGGTWGNDIESRPDLPAFLIPPDAEPAETIIPSLATASHLVGTYPQTQERPPEPEYTGEAIAYAEAPRAPIDVDALPGNSTMAGSSSLSPPVMLGGSSSQTTSESANTSRDAQTFSPKSREPLERQDSPVSGDEPLSAYTCPICFSPPTRATLTPCGHICCGECLFTAVKTTMQRAGHAVPLNERSIAR